MEVNRILRLYQPLSSLHQTTMSSKQTLTPFVLGLERVLCSFPQYFIIDEGKPECHFDQDGYIVECNYRARHTGGLRVPRLLDLVS